MEIVNDLTPAHLAYWEDYDPHLVVMQAPEAMDTCVDCRAVVTRGDDESTVIRVAWLPNEIDLAHLARGGTIWLSTWGGLPPHMLEVQEP